MLKRRRNSLNLGCSCIKLPFGCSRMKKMPLAMKIQSKRMVRLTIRLASLTDRTERSPIGRVEVLRLVPPFIQTHVLQTGAKTEFSFVTKASLMA